MAGVAPLVWWMGVDYELFCATLCTRSVLLVIHSLGYLYHPAYKSMGFGRCAHPRSHPPDYIQWRANPNPDLDLNPDLATFVKSGGCYAEKSPTV